MMSGDASLSTVIPFPCHNLLKEICDDATHGITNYTKIEEMKTYCMEFALLIPFAQKHQCTAVMINFVRCIME